MWYFSWILGLGLAALLSILNAIWLEMEEDTDIHHHRKLVIDTNTPEDYSV